MKISVLFFSSLLLSFSFACHNADESGSPEPEAGINVDFENSVQDASISTIPVERKLIKDGSLSFETDDILGTRKKVNDAINKNDAYIANEEEGNYNSRLEITVTIRVPAENFDQLVNEVSQSVEAFDHKSIDVKDVTEEYLDIKSRLQTKKDLELKYKTILERATTVSEILEIEKQIAELRGDIESIEGRLKYLNDQVAFSTLTVSFYEQVPSATKFSGKFKRGISSGWDNLMWFLVFLVNIWPFIILALAIIIFFRWREKK